MRSSRARASARRPCRRGCSNSNSKAVSRALPAECSSGSRAPDGFNRIATRSKFAHAPRGLALYSRSMFEVLVFVYEHYWRGDACPELQQLERRLSAHGFEPEQIHEALVWLDGLNFAAQNAAPETTAHPELATSPTRQ